MFQKKYIVIKIKGGLGNQLFCYAFGYSIAKKYSAHLYIDKHSGFYNDWKYKRKYLLNNLNLKSNEINIILLIVLKLFLKVNSFFNFTNFVRNFNEINMNYNKNNLILPKGYLYYLEGYWQSENYFFDNKFEIKNQFKFINIPQFDNSITNLINSYITVSLHIRTFDFDNLMSENNLNLKYYHEATKFISKKYPSAFYLIFTNNLSTHIYEFINSLNLTNYIIIKPSSNDDTLRDFFLMQSCNHHIIANSTFSWWAAWLSNSEKKLVIASKNKNKDISAWGFDGLLPDSWILI
jgi:hypothetical protein